ncbi:post-segregation antitoxin CcdA [Pleomorphomonas carboxyditropha]|uniref:Post-segregation antitoxin CcdA n=2 Tax=Pleomorphomonas carboxyditropha TaxID=2023338 RepID=A0A2G9WPM9_9HYPH|nr:post-segregation antitoxin CcdA [Pleomorphomonas carboxyditropha]
MRAVMSTSQSTRKATNLSLDADLVRQARALGVNISQAAEAGVRRAVAEARAEQWRRDNAAALASSNRWVEENGLPLERHRQF